MKVLLDTNVVLDFLLVRKPWEVESSQIWEAHLKGRITAFIAAFALPTVFYIVRRQTDLSRAHDSIRICLESLEVVPVQRSTLELARTFANSDFEDNLQLACATEIKADALVTRNPNDFTGSTIPVITPAELLAKLP